MKKRELIPYLLNPKNWWLPLTVIVTVSLAGVVMIGVHTYTEAPPIPDFVTQNGRVVVSKQQVLDGQAVFQKYGLMDYGSMFGDGGNRGPDYTAEALHVVSTSMQAYYQQDTSQASRALWLRTGIGDFVRSEIKRNRYDAADNTVTVSDAQAHAYVVLAQQYIATFTDPSSIGAFKPTGYITDVTEIKALSAFFFWGAWVCGAERPGETYSYTHNWPYDPDAGNTPTAATIIWSFIGSLGLLLGLGIVLYYHGKMERLDDAAYTAQARPFMTATDVEKYVPHAIQRATYKFFYVAVLLFALQIVAGILTVHDFVGFVNFFGWYVSETLPITITRSWHVQLSILWISMCWIGGSFFVMPMLVPEQTRTQLLRINTVFWLAIIMVAGMFVGIFMGPHGLLGDAWYWLGHQGWEYVELGKVWQILLAVVLALWAFSLWRGLRPVMTFKQPWALPNWMVYATSSIVVLLMSGFIATPTTNFVIADFWRWCVIHMWAEAFFEVFTTILIGYFMVLMGLVSSRAAVRVIYLATLLFLGSGLLGISHNFYWNAKPVGTMALGSVFSTLQVIPLILLTLEAWRFSKLPRLLLSEHKAVTGTETRFGFSEVFLFLMAVNFWNFFGAGVLGFIINLPIANYYEHGTYLTVNHGHAALMGVYGNLAIAAILFCTKLLIHPDRWAPRVILIIFWSINVGLLLMVFLDLFPAGIWQLMTVAEQGLWYARSSAFIDGAPFQTLTWMRMIGGAIFTLGGLCPLVWLVMRGAKGRR